MRCCRETGHVNADFGQDGVSSALADPRNTYQQDHGGLPRERVLGLAGAIWDHSIGLIGSLVKPQRSLMLLSGRVRRREAARDLLSNPLDGCIQMANLSEMFTQQEAVMSCHLAGEGRLQISQAFMDPSER